MPFEETAVVFKGIGPSVITSFPPQYRKGLFKRFERRFWIIFGACALLIGVPILILSYRKIPEQMSAQEIVKIQERYAQLVLKQTPPKPVEETKVDQAKQAAEEKIEEKAKPKVDREKETFVQRQQRKQESAQERKAKRDEIRQEIVQSGIFAAITSTSGGDGSLYSSASTADLLGAVSAVDNLDNINITKGTFATKDIGAEQLQEKRKERTQQNVDIERAKTARVNEQRFAATGKVNITSGGSAQITGNEGAAPSSGRSQASIQQVINKEISRLKRLYEYWLKKDPSLAGQLKIKFKILPTGAVANATVVQSTTNNSEFDQTILRYVKNWTFPADPGGKPVEVVYPFVFGASE